MACMLTNNTHISTDKSQHTDISHLQRQLTSYCTQRQCVYNIFHAVYIYDSLQPSTTDIQTKLEKQHYLTKKRSERRKRCTLAAVPHRCTESAMAVVRQSQNYPTAANPLPGGAGLPKFNQLETVTPCTYRPSLVKIDARNFKLSW